MWTMCEACWEVRLTVFVSVALLTCNLVWLMMLADAACTYTEYVSSVARFGIFSWKVKSKQIVRIKTGNFMAQTFYLGLHVRCRCVNLKLSVTIPLNVFIAGNVIVDCVEKHRSFPAQQDRSVLLTGEIWDNWRRRCSNIGLLEYWNWCIAIVSRCDGDNDDLVFGEGLYK